MPIYTFVSSYASIFQGIDFTNQVIVTEDEAYANTIRSNPFFRNGTILEETLQAKEPEQENIPTIEEEIAKLEAEKPKGYALRVAQLKKKLETQGK